MIPQPAERLPMFKGSDVSQLKLEPNLNVDVEKFCILVSPPISINDFSSSVTTHASRTPAGKSFAKRDQPVSFGFINKVRWLGGSPGLVAMRGDSGSEGREFESWYCILDGHFSHISVVKIVMLV